MDIFTLQFMGKVRRAQAKSRLILLQLLSVHIVCCKIENGSESIRLIYSEYVSSIPIKGTGRRMASFHVAHNYKQSRGTNKTDKIVTFYIDFCQ